MKNFIEIILCLAVLKGSEPPIEKHRPNLISLTKQYFTWPINSLGTLISVLFIELKIININEINKNKSTLLFGIFNLLNFNEISKDEIKNNPVMGNAVGRKIIPERAFD